MVSSASGYQDWPDYRVDVRRVRNLIRISREGQVLGETTASLLVDEQDHGIVFYLPSADVYHDRLVAAEGTSRCPFKGTAKYWRLADQQDLIAWEYEDPALEVALLRGHIAFFQDKVTLDIGVADPAVSGRSGLNQRD